MASSANGRTWATDDRYKPEEELLVFGYSCKLFRDDEKATFIDRGKHLIPWMGDDSLMIDRYDARGYLHDLRQYEPKSGGADYLSALSNEERQLEELCEEERYLALFRDLQEEAIYKEEEIKRLNAALNPETAHKEIAFSYNSENSAESPQAKDDSSEAPFKVPSGLHIPPSVPQPPTMKLHAIIEKTAVFVSQHGPQMEIIIKTKQASNNQFDFLSFDHPLNVYYRFLTEQIKCGTYIPTQVSSGNEDTDDEDDHYLHPSLLPTPSSSVMQEVSKVFLRKDGEDNAYSRLVKNLRPQVDSPGNNSPSQQDVAAQPYADGSGEYGAGEPVPPPPPGLEPILLPAQAALMGYAVPPPPDIQPIIDKMAIYVAKNGDDFETVVKSKGDKRFEFLLPTHQYHTYYLYKKQNYINENKPQDEEMVSSEPAPLPAAVQRVTTIASSLPAPPAAQLPVQENGIASFEAKLPPKFLLGDDGTGSGSNSPSLPSLSADDSAVLPTERSYAKGPVSFSLKAKEGESKEKKCISLVGVDSDSESKGEGMDVQEGSQPSSTVDSSTKIGISKYGDSTERKSANATGTAVSSQDQVPSSKQIQLERKKRLAKFLSMIKDMPGAKDGSLAVQEKSSNPAGTSLRDPLPSLRSPSDSLPGSSPKQQRSGDSSGESPRRSRSRSRPSRHRSKSRSPSHRRSSHHHHSRRHGKRRSRSRSRERKHHRGRGSPAPRSRRSRTPSPSHRSHRKRSQSRSKSSRKR
ncbi:splicing factor, suppressor of white-apricot homolog isoform X2 [Ornithodoros turicata]|uniref:splicing factor, suppressor of white-apricot homolog isoform X2 n=1 Tax=Ornithodoros turicata TaxID=34597 RepID=UPI0031392608